MFNLSDSLFNVEAPEPSSSQFPGTMHNDSGSLVTIASFAKDDIESSPLNVIESLLGEESIGEWISNAGKVHSRVVCPCLATTETMGLKEGCVSIAVGLGLGKEDAVPTQDHDNFLIRLYESFGDRVG